ncbi:hypothetical protein [Bordetella petrii]|uniref:hypothetical protein n=1 Tax=Bordetella petrii TaxID=94624 RepID=UPI001A9569C9|nr:hypothetical protein [Bordetella petrii]MBO1114266.1 hypothetical protein [Bordetella petrii]
MSTQQREALYWEDWALAEAQAGRMSPSNYYQGIYDRLSAMPQMDGSKLTLDLLIHAIDISKKFEAGQISLTDYSTYIVELQSAIALVQRAVRQRRKAAALAAYDEILNTLAAYGLAESIAATAHASTFTLSPPLQTGCMSTPALYGTSITTSCTTQ